MNEDLPGRIDNTFLPASRPLLPVFDAIINAMHAIEDAKATAQLTGNGHIVITVERDRSAGQKEIDGVEAPDEEVAGFVVEDDGVGFNDANRNSFDTADSRYKRNRGAKGVGRFLWLKAFRGVEIASTFVGSDGAVAHREFHFRLPNGIDGENVRPANTDETRGTRLSLSGYLPKYRQACPKSLDAIADHVIEHCLVSLLRKDAPSITLRDYRHSVSVTERLGSQALLADSARDKFEVKGTPFRVEHFHVRVRSAKPRIHYLANDREVISEVPPDPDLAQRLPYPSGGTFALVSYVSGSVLDSHLNPERTGFTLPSREDSSVLTSELCLEDIKEAARSKILEHAAPFVAPLREQKMEEIKTFIQTRAPQYRPLLGRHRNELERIPPGLPSDKLEVELHRIRARIEAETKDKVAKLLTVTDYDGYKARVQDVIEQLNEVGKAALIENIVHRHLVLQILSKHLERRADGQEGYYLEEDIHRILFPMRATSDDVPFEDQNLWVIDERLTYHRYLASDKRLADMELLQTDDKTRPDIVIWNNPSALTDDPGAAPQQSLTIVEFKRPMRSGSYPPGEAPPDQVIEYVQKIQDNHALDRKGRPLRVSPSSPFYVYILCDLVPALVDRLKNMAFIETPDGNGFFQYNPSRRAWIEVLSYDKVVGDARKRNRALFDLLNLPTA